MLIDVALLAQVVDHAALVAAVRAGRLPAETGV
jgi:hypothetical protein